MAEVFEPRGLAHYGDIGMDMFPSKYERTQIYEPRGMVNNEWRNTLKDFSSDTMAMASDVSRRNYDNSGRLALRYSNLTRNGLDPWNPDLFLSFTDKDYRGHLTEIPWEKMRHHTWHKKSWFEPSFKDDSDHSVPSAGIHPATLYPMMRRTQPWAKSRMKIFSTGKDGWQHGGIVPKQSESLRRHYIGGPPENMVYDLTLQDPSQRPHRTTVISNIFNLGYDSITDHEFKVAGYGKIYKTVGQMNHHSQVHYNNPDHPKPIISENERVPKSLVVLMATDTNTDSLSGNADGTSAFVTAAEQTRKTRQSATGDEPNPEINGLRSTAALESIIRGQRPASSVDIAKILGFIAYDTELQNSRYRNNTKLPTPQIMQEINYLTELVHSLPANVRLEVQNELIRKAYHANAGLAPSGNIRGQKQATVINPKIIEFMANTVASSKAMGDVKVKKSKDQSKVDENTWSKFADMELLVPKSAPLRETLKNKRNAKKGKRKYAGIDDNLTTVSYKGFANKQIEKNRNQSNNAQYLANSQNTNIYAQSHTLPGVIGQDMTVEDVDMSEFAPKERYVAPLGNKYQRRNMEYEDLNGELTEVIA